MLKVLQKDVPKTEKQKGKRHQVFKLSFDAQDLMTEKSLERVLDYIHENPVSGKWKLADNYVDFPYSSAGFYDRKEKGIIDVFDYRNISSS